MKATCDRPERAVSVSHSFRIFPHFPSLVAMFILALWSRAIIDLICSIWYAASAGESIAFPCWWTFEAPCIELHFVQSPLLWSSSCKTDGRRPTSTHDLCGWTEKFVPLKVSIPGLKHSDPRWMIISSDGALEINVFKVDKASPLLAGYTGILRGD